MKIVSSYFTGPIIDDVNTLTHRYQYMMFNIDQTIIDYVDRVLLPGKTVILFSGSWRLFFDATYIELKMVEMCNLNFHKSTLFVEPNNRALFDLVLRSLAPQNLAVLHSDYWSAHQPIDQLISNLDNLLKYVAPGGQVVCTVPLNHLNFNRLTTTYQDLGFDIVEDSAVIVRK